jgi:hypothetical protein
MIMRMATAAALTLVLAGTALAQAPSAPAPEAPAVAAPGPSGSQAAAPAEALPDTASACIAAAAELGEAADGKTLSEEKLDKLDQLFSQMESLCDNQQFTEAMAIAGDIRTMLDGN